MDTLSSNDVNSRDRHRNLQGVGKCFIRRNIGLKGIEIDKERERQRQRQRREKDADFQTSICSKWTKPVTLLQTCDILSEKERILQKAKLQAQWLEPLTTEDYPQALKLTEFHLLDFQFA